MSDFGYLCLPFRSFPFLNQVVCICSHGCLLTVVSITLQATLRSLYGVWCGVGGVRSRVGVFLGHDVLQGRVHDPELTIIIVQVDGRHGAVIT